MDVAILSSQQNLFPSFAKNLDQPTNDHLSPPFTLCPPSAQFQAVLPIRGLLHNPTYNLSIIGSEDEQPFFFLDLKAGSPLERCSEGYQPQNEQDVFFRKQISQEPESPLLCPAYIILPKSDPQ